MIRTVYEILIEDFTTVDAYWGIRRVQDIAEKADLDCFPVSDNGKIIGILTRRDMMTAHPNRIVLDAMSGNCEYIGASESIWKAKELFDASGVDILVVTERKKNIGIVTKSAVAEEICKHMDLLTGLYKSSYVFYNAFNILEQGREISIIFFDVNNFGQINKEYGHTIGDQILQDITKILKDNTPDNAFLCRYGGDEFALLTDQCTEASEEMAKKILEKINDHKFCEVTNISVAAGIAGGKRRYTKKENLNESITKLINIASLASTKAKKVKKNLVLGYSGFIDHPSKIAINSLIG